MACRKHIRVTLLTTFVLQAIFALPSVAQFTVGPRVGVNFSTYNRAVTLDSSDVSRTPTFHAGLTFDYWIHKKLAIQSGLFYSGMGQKYELEPALNFPQVNATDTFVSRISGTLNPSGFKVPLLFTYDSDGMPGLGKDDGAFDGVRVEAGIYAAYMVQVKSLTTTEYSIVRYDSLGNGTELGTSTENSGTKLDIGQYNFNRFDMGIQFGFGIEKSVGIGTLLINFNFNFGLLDLYRLAEAEKPTGYKPVNYRDWGISLTYFFPSLRGDKKKTTKPVPKK